MNKEENIIKNNLEGFLIKDYDTEAGWKKLSKKKLEPKRKINWVYWAAAASIIGVIVFSPFNNKKTFDAEKLGTLTIPVQHISSKNKTKKINVNHNNVIAVQKKHEKKNIIIKKMVNKKSMITVKDFSVKEQENILKKNPNNIIQEEILVKQNITPQENSLKNNTEYAVENNRNNITLSDDNIQLLLIQSRNNKKRKTFFQTISRQQNDNRYEKGSSKENITINL